MTGKTRRELIEELRRASFDALELSELLGAEPPAAFDQIEAQDLEDITVLLRQAAAVSAAATAPDARDHHDHLRRIVGRRIESARVAVSWLGSGGGHWAHETARLLEQARLHVETGDSGRERPAFPNRAS